MDDNKKAAAYATATSAGVAGALALEAMDEPKRKPRKRRPIKKSSNASSIRLAEEEVKRLQTIKSRDLSPKDRDIKEELIKRQKDIIKGLKPESLTKIATRLGLKSIPGVGAFLSNFIGKPAGKGSSLDGFNKGGMINHRGRPASGSAEKNN